LENENFKFEKIGIYSKKGKGDCKKGFKALDCNVLAKEQTGGYGRKGNFWYSPKGGLYFSVILPKYKD
jgi:biotin-(acetyl-CoA carboxylase) ligase